MKHIANLASRAHIRLSGVDEEGTNFAWRFRGKVFDVKLKQKRVKTRKHGNFIEAVLSFKVPREKN